MRLPGGHDQGAVTELCLAALTGVPGLGGQGIRRLVAVFGSPQEALEASPEELAGRGRLSAEVAREVQAAAAHLDQVEVELSELKSAGGRLIVLGSECYPENLRLIEDPPPLLYVMGSLLPSDSRAVAVVGTRTPSPDGEGAAGRLAEELAAAEVTVVSGMARGIDRAAHQGALRADGRTVAVLGCGLLRALDAGQDLPRRIADRGALVSERPPRASASRETLLARNRIQAGLSRAVVVAQARRRGGSYVAAEHARRHGRPLFAFEWADPEFRAGWERLHDMGAQAVDLQKLLAAASVCVAHVQPELFER